MSEIATNRPANNSPRVHVDDRIHENRFFHQTHVSKISRPQLIRCCQLKPSYQIWKNQFLSCARTSRPEPGLRRGKERESFQHSSDSLRINFFSRAEQMLMKSPITVTWKIFLNSFDFISEREIFFKLKIFTERRLPNPGRLTRSKIS